MLKKIRYALLGAGVIGVSASCGIAAVLITQKIQSMHDGQSYTTRLLENVQKYFVEKGVHFKLDNKDKIPSNMIEPKNAKDKDGNQIGLVADLDSNSTSIMTTMFNAIISDKSFKYNKDFVKHPNEVVEGIRMLWNYLETASILKQETYPDEYHLNVKILTFDNLSKQYENLKIYIDGYDIPKLLSPDTDAGTAIFGDKEGKETIADLYANYSKHYIFKRKGFTAEQILLDEINAHKNTQIRFDKNYFKGFIFSKNFKFPQNKEIEINKYYAEAESRASHELSASNKGLLWMALGNLITKAGFTKLANEVKAFYTGDDDDYLSITSVQNYLKNIFTSVCESSCEKFKEWTLVQLKDYKNSQAFKDYTKKVKWLVFEKDAFDATNLKYMPTK